MMKGYVASSGVVAVVASVLLVRDVPWQPSRALVGPMLAFGLPLIVSGFAGRFLYFGDRFVIVHHAAERSRPVGHLVDARGEGDASVDERVVVGLDLLLAELLDADDDGEAHEHDAEHEEEELLPAHRCYTSDTRSV